MPATAPHTHPRGLGGREGAGASRSPSDGEMWPFTFTLQCQPLNHCLRARAQGCSPRRPPTKPPPPPRTRAQSPAQPRRPGRDGSRPRLLRPLCLPLSRCLCLSLSVFIPRTYLRDQAATGSRPKLTKNLKFTFLWQTEGIRKTGEAFIV